MLGVNISENMADMCMVFMCIINSQMVVGSYLPNVKRTTILTHISQEQYTGNVRDIQITRIESNLKEQFPFHIKVSS